MKFHALAYEFAGEGDEDFPHVEFRIYNSHRELTAARHALKHLGIKNMKTLPMVDVPATKAGLLYVNYMTAAAARYSDVDWFIYNFKPESERLLGEGCIDES